MVKAECIFCKIVEGQIPCTKIFENDRVLAFLDIGPISDGHVLVIPKSHVDRIDQASVQVLADVSGCVGKIAGVIAEVMSADGYNVLCNNGTAAGQVVKHLHFHIIPRKVDDGLFGHWPAKGYNEGIAESIAEKIRKKL